MVDLLTVVPIWITINSEPVKYSEIHTFNDTLLYILFFLNTTRVLRSLRIYKKLNTITDEVQRSLGEMVLTVVVLILFSELL